MGRRQILERYGYTGEYQENPGYRGNTNSKKRIFYAERGGKMSIALNIENSSEIGHYARLRRILPDIPNVCQVLDVIENIVVFEKASGALIWHMERVDTDRVIDALRETVEALARHELVHSDIRPWNVFATDEGVSLIDWNFSFFRDEICKKRREDHLRLRGHEATPVEEIDNRDVELMRRVLQGEISVYEAWRHPRQELLWHPMWRPSCPPC